MTTLSPPTLDEIEAARSRLAPYLQPTPLIPLQLDLPDRRIFLKLETLSPIGAFKLRPALNALLSRDKSALENGVATISSGNMAYGMAWAARRLGVPMAAYMYENAPQTKIDNVRAEGGEVRFVSMETWWRYAIGKERPQGDELVINPITDQGVLAGNGTIGLEIARALPQVDCLFAPYGGGSLLTGAASALKALCPNVKTFAAEDDHAAPVSAALAAGAAVEIETRPSFIKSIGGPSVVPDIWPLARQFVDGSEVLSHRQITDAMRLLFSKAKIVAEGAGAASLAAALASKRATGNIVCIVSGGNIGAEDFATVLKGGIPRA